MTQSNLQLCPTYVVVLLAAIGIPPTLAQGEVAQGEVAQGIVFSDSNGNGQIDAGEQRLAGVKVSNGRQIAVTDGQGQYKLPVDDDTILFVIKPRNWQSPLNADQLPQFYYIHKPTGSPDSRFPGVGPTGPLPSSVDFPLHPQSEPQQFRAVLFGDPQPRNQTEVDYIAHDVVEELIGTEASFGVTLGDIVFDDLSIFGPLNRTIALIGIPWYNVVGNHDINLDARQDKESDETFERFYGPAYYSFDHGPVHFLVLDDIEWYLKQSDGKGTYRGGLDPEQMEFIRNDLASIPDQQLVVLMMHIPLVDVHNRQELYRLIEQRPFCISISGHTHHHEHRFIHKEDGWLGPEPHHHIVNVTVSGSWWAGAPDERRIPHATMADGAPNGYSFINFDGTNYSLDFKAAGRPSNYQMEISAPEAITLSRFDKPMVYANLFNGSERSTVEVKFGRLGSWTPMEHSREMDPTFAATAAAEKQLAGRNWRSLPNPKPSTHLWKAPIPDDLPAGTHLIQIRTTDMHGRHYQDQRVLRVNGGE